MDTGRPLPQLQDSIEAGLERFFLAGQAGAVLHRLLELLLQQIGIFCSIGGERQQQSLLFFPDLPLVDLAGPDLAPMGGRGCPGAAAKHKQIRQRVPSEPVRPV